jgi:hypothetical protein
MLGGWSRPCAGRPADDALAKLNELSRQAEQTTEAMHSAQLDLNNKLAVQQAADAKHAADVAAAESAKSQLATFQSSVDKLAAAQYMGGRTDGLDAMLTATSPQGLIDQLSVQRVMAAEMSAQMKSYREIGRRPRWPRKRRPNRLPTPRPPPSRPPRCAPTCNPSKASCSCRSRWSSRSTRP